MTTFGTVPPERVLVGYRVPKGRPYPRQLRKGTDKPDVQGQAGHRGSDDAVNSNDHSKSPECPERVFEGFSVSSTTIFACI